MPDHRVARTRAAQPLPPEILNIVGLMAAIAVVALVGAGIASILPETKSEWLTVSAFAAPAGLAFLAYWWVDQSR